MPLRYYNLLNHAVNVEVTFVFKEYFVLAASLFRVTQTVDAYKTTWALDWKLNMLIYYISIVCLE